MLKVFPASLDQLYAMLDFVRESAAKVGFDEQHILKIELAAEEALVNIITHGYTQTTSGDILISCDCPPEEKGLKIIIKDQGVPFNPLLEPHELQDSKLENRKIGGLGIIFILKLMDKVNYERDKKFNVLTLVKYA